jgi:NAD+ synthase
VKQGDGAADLKPIAHLYKTQVYALAEALGVPEEVRVRTPTTDTFSLAQTQHEFFFGLPYRELDLCLYALDHHTPQGEVASATGMSLEQVERVFRDIESKRRAAEILRRAPILMES